MAQVDLGDSDEDVSASVLSNRIRKISRDATQVHHQGDSGEGVYSPSRMQTTVAVRRGTAQWLDDDYEFDDIVTLPYPLVGLIID